jgi:hypothetical protein
MNANTLAPFAALPASCIQLVLNVFLETTPDTYAACATSRTTWATLSKKYWFPYVHWTDPRSEAALSIAWTFDGGCTLLAIARANYRRRVKNAMRPCDLFREAVQQVLRFRAVCSHCGIRMHLESDICLKCFCREGAIAL